MNVPKSPQKLLAYLKHQRESRAANGVCCKCGSQPPAEGRKNCEACLAVMCREQKDSLAKLRAKVIAGYGGRCQCCGENIPEFLTLDHVNNDGKQHRASLGHNRGGSPMMRWAVSNNYPDSLQLLCWNCNLAKSLYGECPHKTDAQLAQPIHRITERPNGETRPSKISSR